MLKVVLVLLLLVALAPTAHSDVKFVKGDKTKPNVAEWSHLAITGKITKADVEQLRPLIVEATVESNLRVAGALAPQVMLHSLGGDVSAAIRIGRTLRALNAVVFVGLNAECSSACVLILAAGAQRDVFNGARVGLHRPYFEDKEFVGLNPSQARERYAVLEHGVRAYLKEMAIPDALFERMRAIPSRKIVYLSTKDLSALGLVGTDPATEELQRAKEKQYLGEDLAKYLDEIRNCADAGTPFSVCQERAQRSFKKRSAN